MGGLDSARIPVRVWARDPISLAGLTSALVCRPELKIVEPGSAHARVALVAAESLDEMVLSQLRTISAQGTRTVLVITALTDDDVLAVVDAGVSAIVWRWEATATWLSEVVVKAAAGQPALPADVLSRLLKQVGRLNRQVLSPRGLTLNGLSAREIEVLKLAADGLDTEEIAHQLAYSQRTVTNVFHDITCRFHLRNRTHAVAYAIREGLI
jgi:DNA-binding NarL/FixJ family response regulator